VDWALRQFHGHELSTHRGSSYNAYLIIDEKTVLVDTVWGPFQEQLIEEHLGRCKIPVVAEGVRTKCQPKPDDLIRCTELGQKIAGAINAPQ
jgi:flavorubredoxin